MTTNGESTEMAYLDALLKTSLVSPLITRRKVKFFRMSPSDLLRVSLAELHRLGYDHLYTVTDVDDFGQAAVSQAVRDFARKGARLIVCNPCFESWLVLHFEDCQAHLADGAQAGSRLRRHVPNYDKTALDFAAFAHLVESATERARHVEDAMAVNPSSTMWILIDGLRDPTLHDATLRQP